MNLKQSALAAAVTATLALGASGQASAYVYGASGLTIDDLNVAFFGPNVNVTVTRFDFNQSNLSTLGGNTVGSAASCGGLPGLGNNNCNQVIGSMDAAATNAPGSAPLRVNNQITGGEFTFLGPGPTDYSNADTWITSAELVNLGSPTHTHNIAESLLATDTPLTNASANSQIQSITGVEITFDVMADGPANFRLAFTADPDLRAAISGEHPLATYSAQANLNTSITLQNNTGPGFINWTPQGTAAQDCAFIGVAACVELADSQDLNINVGTTSNNTTADHSWDPNAINLTPFGLQVIGMAPGRWTLTLNEAKSDQLARTVFVPEPGVLALMGLGLMGLFATSRRRKLG